ncbi:MAG: DUF2155 domain-containing protein [Albidovulum sp.]|nr:DUF2155 domain-containing protein [Albidovulum sp.]MDE0304158.1 DUF2155 domain-containing protein [Albidovulum sp.]MDE0533471.1 DUF2155 domain-containing protein [Albidovulum sp.]
MKAVLAAAAMAASMVAAAAGQEALNAPGALLRGLDTIAGKARDISIRIGETVKYGRLEITLHECRYLSENPVGNAFARLSIYSEISGKLVFGGWMLSSSPALSSMDHQRYDVWLIRCNTVEPVDAG